MTLRELVVKLGKKDVAKRLKITESTLTKWINKGPSKAGLHSVEVIINRHLVSVKSAATRKLRKVGIDSLPPSGGIIGTEVPDKPLYQDEDVILITPGDYPIKSDINIGVTTWVNIGKPADQVTIDFLYDIAVDIWQRSKRDYCVLKFLLFRYIPKTSTHAVIDRRGRWVDHWWTSDALSTELAIRRRIDFFLNEYAHKWAETRIIWFESMGVSCFDRIRETMPSREELTRRKLR